MCLLADGGIACIFLVSPLSIDRACWCNYAKVAPEEKWASFCPYSCDTEAAVL